MIRIIGFEGAGLRLTDIDVGETCTVVKHPSVFAQSRAQSMTAQEQAENEFHLKLLWNGRSVFSPEQPLLYAPQGAVWQFAQYL